MCTSEVYFTRACRREKGDHVLETLCPWSCPDVTAGRPRACRPRSRTRSPNMPEARECTCRGRRAPDAQGAHLVLRPTTGRTASPPSRPSSGSRSRWWTTTSSTVVARAPTSPSTASSRTCLRAQGESASPPLPRRVLPSAARFFKGRGCATPPPPVRTRRHPRGLPRDQLLPRYRDELDKANLIMARTCALLLAGWCRTQFAVESPCDRGDPVQERLHLHKDHAPLWLMLEMIALQKLAAAKLVTFRSAALEPSRKSRLRWPSRQVSTPGSTR